MGSEKKLNSSGKKVSPAIIPEIRLLCFCLLCRTHGEGGALCFQWSTIWRRDSAWETQASIGKRVWQMSAEWTNGLWVYMYVREHTEYFFGIHILT